MDGLKNKTLLLITSWYPSKGSDTSSPFVFGQVDEIKRYFKKVQVISLNPYVPKFMQDIKFKKIFDKFKLNKRWHSDIFWGHYLEDYKYDNVEVYFAKYFTLPLKSSWEKRGDVAFTGAHKIIQKEKIEFDLIHAHFIYLSGYVGAKLKEGYGVPLIITGHGHDVYDLPFKDAEWNKKIRNILNTADHIITVSKSNYDKLMQLDISDEKVSIIPNGYDSALFKNNPINKAKEKLNIPKDKKILLTVGNLGEVKGYKYLIEAMKEVVKHRKDVPCIIVGSGKLKNKLENQIKKLGLNDYVKLVGAKPHDEIPIWMNACDVFALPSLNEGNPTVMFECLGCGKPFVGTRVGGIPEIITSEDYGLLCEPANPKALAEKILIALEKEWDVKEILRYAERFKWDNIAKEIIKTYETVLLHRRDHGIA